MRVLISVVGTRGDVQPVIALALALRAIGHEARLAVPPNFTAWASDLGFDATPVGVAMRAPRAGEPPSAPPSVDDLIADQFRQVGLAAHGCDVVLAANAHQYAARSVAEHRGLPYTCALYAPTSLPSPAGCAAWNARALGQVNTGRAALGLAPLDDVLSRIVTDRPLLASDPTLDPPRPVAGLDVVQTGAWLLDDPTPLPPEVEGFLGHPDEAIYVGMGSMPLPPGLGASLVQAARAMGRPVLVARGWASSAFLEEAPGVRFVDEVNHQALFGRVAAVVHHGGAGTTVTAARAGVPQVVVPLYSDQPHWAGRVAELGIGRSVPLAQATPEALRSALGEALRPEVAVRARELAPSIVSDGAARAARWLTASR